MLIGLYHASSLKQQSVCRHVAQLEHLILFPSQPIFTLSLSRLAAKQYYQLYVLGLTRSGLEPTIYHTLARALIITPLMRLYKCLNSHSYDVDVQDDKTLYNIVSYHELHTSKETTL